MTENIINYKDIKINMPYKILRIEKLIIEAEPNNHGKLYMEAIVSAEQKDEYITSLKYNDKIKIDQYENDKYKRILFVGQPYKVELKVLREQYILVIESLSYTYNMDIEKKRRSYQEKSMTYESLIKSVIKDYNDPSCFMTVAKGDIIDIFTLQYDETDWQFLKRLCSRFESVLITDCREGRPKFYFGLPYGNNIKLEETKYRIKKKVDPFRDSKDNYKYSVYENDYISYEIETKEYMYLGDNVTLKNINMKVSKILMTLENGILMNNYTLTPSKGIRQDLIKNEKIIGLSLEGLVIGRQADEIKIKLDIDNKNPDCGTRWFKYESNYTVGADWGWYVMPEMGHIISLYMPTSLEEDAYSNKSIRRNGDSHPKTSDPIEKRLGTHHYKELLMDNEQLKITVKDDKTGQMYLQMKEERGIEIKSDKDILFKSKEDINLLANKMKLKAENGIYFINRPGSVILNGTTEFYNTIIDRKATSEEELELMNSKKAAIMRSAEGLKSLGRKSLDKNQSECGGDPVDMATGNYVINQTDMIINGVTPIIFSRFYNALDNYEGLLGKNWHHNYDVKLKKNKNMLSIIWGDGRIEDFSILSDGLIVSNDDASQVINIDEDDCYIIKFYTDEIYKFNNEGFLISIITKEKNETFLNYENGLLSKIENKSGYIKLNYFNKCLSSISDAMGRFVEYKYSNNSLVKVRNINGGYTLYEYDSDFQITQVNDPNGNVMVKNIYDSKGRIAEQTMPNGGKVYLIYDDNKNTTTFIERNDTETVYRKDDKGRIIEKQTISGIEKMNFNSSGNLTEFIDKNGNIYTYSYGKTFTITNPNGDSTEITYNDDGNIIMEKYADGSEHKYEYDKLGKVSKYVDPFGYETIFIYDKSENLIMVNLPDGSQKKYTYDERGNILSYEDEENNITRLKYDKANRIIEHIQPMHNKTNYFYNETDKITNIMYPNKLYVKRKYDYCDLLKEEVDESGGITSYEYLKNGKLSKKIDALGGITEYEYDIMDNLTCIKNPDGSKKINRYNESNFLTATVDEEGYVKNYFYDANGNIIKEVDERGNTTKYEYDSLNRLIKEIDANYGETIYKYRYDNKIIEKTDALGGITKNIYDKMGRLISTKNAIDAEIKFIYDERGYLIKEINPYGAETIYEYNKVGKIIKVLYADETFEKMEYDSNGNLIKYIDCGGGITQYEYDEMDRVCCIINALEKEKKITYNPIGKISSVKNEKGHTTSYLYDLNNNLVKVTNAKGHSTTYKYDALNRLTEIHQYNNLDSETEKELITTYKYNRKGLLLQETDAKGQITFYNYDSSGNLIQKEDRDGYITQFEYDALNNLTKTKYGDNKIVEYEYDALNRMISMTDWLGQTTYDLDILGRVKKVQDVSGNMINYKWGLMNEKKNIKYPDGSIVDYEFDINGRISKAVSGRDITEYVYNPIGTIAKEILSNGQVSEYLYDEMSQMTKLIHYDKNGDIFEQREFYYDESGCKTGINLKAYNLVRTHSENTHKKNGVYQFEYDELNQIIKSKNPNNKTEIYSYDNLGNVIKKEVRGAEKKLDTKYYYDELNRLVKISGKGEKINGFILDDYAEVEYDSRGNMTRIKSKNKNIAEYIYDNTGSLIRTSTHFEVVASYAYDGAGRRVRKEINNQNYDYLVDVTTPYNNLLSVIHNNGQRENYIYGNKLIGVKKSDDIEYFYLNDEMGSLSRITDKEGNTIGQVETDSFGNSVRFGIADEDINGLISFTGYEEEYGTGLQFVQARYYMPEFRRFIEEDTNKGNIFDFQSLNRYVHCYNNPLMYIDKDGHAGTEVIADYIVKKFGYQFSSYTKLTKTTGMATFVSKNNKGEEQFITLEGRLEDGKLVVEKGKIKTAIGEQYDDRLIGHYSGDVFDNESDTKLAYKLKEEARINAEIEKAGENKEMQKKLKEWQIKELTEREIISKDDGHTFVCKWDYIKDENSDYNFKCKGWNNEKQVMGWDSTKFKESEIDKSINLKGIIIKFDTLDLMNKGEKFIICNFPERINEYYIDAPSKCYISKAELEAGGLARIYYSNINIYKKGDYEKIIKYIIRVENIDPSGKDAEITYSDYKHSKINGTYGGTSLLAAEENLVNFFDNENELTEIIKKNGKFDIFKTDVKYEEFATGVIDLKTDRRIKITVFAENKDMLITEVGEEQFIESSTLILDTPTKQFKYPPDKDGNYKVYSGVGDGYKIKAEAILLDSMFKVDGLLRSVILETGNSRSNNINHRNGLEEIIPFDLCHSEEGGIPQATWSENNNGDPKNNEPQIRERAANYHNIANWFVEYHMQITLKNKSGTDKIFTGYLIPTGSVGMAIKKDNNTAVKTIISNNLISNRDDYSIIFSRKKTEEGDKERVIRENKKNDKFEEMDKVEFKEEEINNETKNRLKEELEILYNKSEILSEEDIKKEEGILKRKYTVKMERWKWITVKVGKNDEVVINYKYIVGTDSSPHVLHEWTMSEG